MRTLFLTAALLSTVTLPAAATDLLPVKAPQLTPQAIINDWSGFYVGGAGGFGWGREKFDNPKTSIDNLFPTNTGDAFGSNPVLVQPGFTIPGDLSQKFKERGFLAGGFFGAQKQFGNWVLGIEADMYATGMKMSFSGNSSKLENITLIDPTGTVMIPEMTVQTTPRDNVPVTVTVDPTGLLMTVTAGGFDKNSTLAKGAQITVTLFSEPGSSNNPVQVKLTTTTDLPVDANGQVHLTLGSGGNVQTNGGVQTNITTNATTASGTANIPALDVIIPAHTGTSDSPHGSTVQATVSRSLTMTSRIEELASVRGKIGLATSSNWMIYGTGGPAWAHVTRTLNISQTAVFVPSEGPTLTRTNSFSASTGETRLGFAIGAGMDWKLTPNLVLGALYLHYEFPKGTVTFADGSTSVGFGTSRQSADAITGRLSWMVPIH